MNLAQLETRLVPLYLSSVAPGGGPPEILSDPGIGKTSTTETVAQRLEQAFAGKRFGYVSINGASVTLSHATGYLILDGDGDRSKFSKPDWWFKTRNADNSFCGDGLEAFDGGVIIIDESDKLGVDEKKIMGEGALSKILGSHPLPPGWCIWFLGNYPKNRSGSTKQLDHLINRVKRIHIKFDLDAWDAWAERSGLLPEVRNFAKENVLLMPEPAPEEQGPWCTPRSLHQCDIDLQTQMRVVNSPVPLTDPLTQEEMAGRIGTAAAAMLMAQLKLGQALPPYEEILANPDTAPVPSKPDALRLSSYRLAYLVKPKELDPIMRYVKRMKMEEFQIIFGKNLITKDVKCITNPAFVQWAKTKMQLIALMVTLK